MRNLFFNVPARRRFLRTESTELALLRQLFTIYALAHPETGLTFTSDSRTLCNLPGGSTLADRIAELYTPSFSSHLRRLQHEQDGVVVSGYAGLPQTGRRDRSEQYVFVNGRPASAPVIYHALNEAYHPVLARGRHPAAFLFLDMDPAQVDVNVHPAKKEVRFRRPTAVRDAVSAAVTEALALNPADAGQDEVLFRIEVPPAAPRVETQQPLPVDPLPSFRGGPDAVVPEPGAGELVPQSALTSPPIELNGDGAGASPWKWCRLLGQVGGSYAVLETEDGLVLMDPQAAHERVLFEKLMNGVATGNMSRQGLLTPEVVSLMPAEAESLRRQIPVLDEMGFGISEFGPDAFLVDALPLPLQEQSPALLLSGIAAALQTAGSVARAARDVLHETVAQAACRAAVRSGDFISGAGLERLVNDLAKTEMPYTCPHGRPTLIFTSYAELNRKFGR